jgi:hypothetical protein
MLAAGSVRSCDALVPSGQRPVVNALPVLISSLSITWVFSRNTVNPARCLSVGLCVDENPSLLVTESDV